MKILLIDVTCPKPYSDATLRTEPMGGTEATVVRVAEAMAKRGHKVRVAQHNRTETHTSLSGVEYVAFGQSKEFNPEHVILLRQALALPAARQQFPSARFTLWCHDLFPPGEQFVQMCHAIEQTHTMVVCVSEYHRTQFMQSAIAAGFGGKVFATRIYNPIDDDLRADKTPIDKDKMVFFASPHKGLIGTLEVFDKFQNFEELKDVKLYVANPGYIPSADTGGIRNVVNLGALPHSDVIAHVRSALCVLHLNSVFPETFGIVHAEANAVGTPWLSGFLGANYEIVDHPHECIDLNDTKAVIDRLILWRTKGRPVVRPNAGFRLSRICREWEDYLGRRSR